MIILRATVLSSQARTWADSQHQQTLRRLFRYGEADDLERLKSKREARLARAASVEESDEAEGSSRTTGSVAVVAGQQVRVGDVLGRVGHTGNSTAPHLHFQLTDGPDR